VSCHVNTRQTSARCDSSCQMRSEGAAAISQSDRQRSRPTAVVAQVATVVIGTTLMIRMGDFHFAVREPLLLVARFSPWRPEYPWRIRGEQGRTEVGSLQFQGCFILVYRLRIKSHGSSVGIATELPAGRPRAGRSSSPGKVNNIPFSISSRPPLGPTQPPMQ
jgi:hypothetical protein